VILGDGKETDMPELLDLITAGAYFPALALGLVLATHALRRARVDAWLARLLDAGDVRWLRPWIPMTLASAAFAIATLTGAMETAMAAAQSLAALVTAMAGHDAGQAVLALLRAVLGPTAGPPAPPPKMSDPDEREPDVPDEHLVRHRPRTGPAPDSIRRRLHVAETVVTALASVALLVGCDYEYDDPDDPGAIEGVHFVRVTEPGRVQEWFENITFQAGEMAVDTLRGPLAYPVRLGPGSSLMTGVEDDWAPYPNPAGARKHTLHTGALDDRYWVQFAGGAWNTLNIEAHPKQQFRASSSPPSFVPLTVLRWCPETRPCMAWLTAVARREVRCYRYSLNGRELPVAPATCVQYHPRVHWRVRSCDDCPIPAVTDADL
jgi:hypothetical protein